MNTTIAPWTWPKAFEICISSAELDGAGEIAVAGDDEREDNRQLVVAYGERVEDLLAAS